MDFEIFKDKLAYYGGAIILVLVVVVGCGIMFRKHTPVEIYEKCEELCEYSGLSWLAMEMDVPDGTLECKCAKSKD